MDSGLQTVFLIDEAGHSLADPVFRRSLELAVVRVQMHYKHHGMHSRWGLKFFNSDGTFRLGDKQHTYDMCSPAADIVRQEFATIAHSLSVQAPKAVGAGSVATSIETRSKIIKTALQDLLGDGLRDGSFPESTARSAGVGSVSSVARTHHAVYLFSPGNGPVALLGDGDAGPGAVKELRKDAKCLNEAFRKYSIVLQWVDTSSAVTKLASAHPGRSCADASKREALQARQASLSPFLLECIKDCKGSRIPFEALLQPSQVMPFSMILETCLANGGLDVSSHVPVDGCSGTRRDVEAAAGEGGLEDGQLFIKASLHLNSLDRVALSLQLSPVSSRCLTAIQNLSVGDVGKGTPGWAFSSGLSVVVEEWVEREDVSPSWFLSDAAFWCEEADIEGEEEQSAIPETPSPTKLAGACKSISTKDEEHMDAETRPAPSLVTMLNDLTLQNSLLLVSVRPAIGEAEPSLSSVAVGSSKEQSSAGAQLALLGGIAPNGRVGFLQFVSEAAGKHSPTDVAAEQSAASGPDGGGAATLESFVSHMLEEWMWKQCDRLLELGPEQGLAAAGTNVAEAATASASGAIASKDAAARATEPGAELLTNEDTKHVQQGAATRPEEMARSKLLLMARCHKETPQSSSSAHLPTATSCVMIAQGAGSVAAVSAGGDGSNSLLSGDSGGDEGAEPSDIMSQHAVGQARVPQTEEEVLQELDVRYELLQTEYLKRAPGTLFDQVIPEYIGFLEQLQNKLQKCESSSIKTPMGDPGLDAGEGPQGTVHSEDEYMRDGVDGKQPSGPKMTEKRGGEGEQEKTGASAADSGKDPRKIIMSHVKSNWIKEPKEWKAWVGKGVTKDVCKRRHEFQALLRLYVVGFSGKPLSDPLPLEGRMMQIVLSALSRFFVNMSTSDKLRYIEQTLQPLCRKHLPRTLEQIVENFGLTVEEDEPGNEPSMGAAAAARSSAGHEVEAVPTPVYGKRSAESVRSSAGESSWPHTPRHANSSRVVSHGGIAASDRTQSLSRRGAPAVKGSKLAQRKVTRMGLGSNSIKERTIGKKKNASKGATAGQRSKSGSSALGIRTDSLRLLATAGKKECKERAPQHQQGLTSSRLNHAFGDHDVGSVSSQHLHAAGSSHCLHGGAARDSQHVAADQNQLLSTPARCKVAAVVVPETPEAKAGNAPAQDTSCKKPPRMNALPPVDKFEDSMASRTSALPPRMADLDAETQGSAEASMQANPQAGNLEPAAVNAAVDAKDARILIKRRGGAIGRAAPDIAQQDGGGNQLRSRCVQKAAPGQHAALGRGDKCEASGKFARPEDLTEARASATRTEGSAHDLVSLSRNETGELEVGDDGGLEEEQGEEEQAQQKRDDQPAVEFYRYQTGDLVLVSTEHVMRKVKRGKKKYRYCDRYPHGRCSNKSIAKVIGPFEVVAAREESRTPKYKLKVPAKMQLVSSWVEPSSLQIFRTRAELLSAPCKTRTMARAESAELKIVEQQGLNFVEWVLDIQELAVADEKKPVQDALVAWQGDYPEDGPDPKYTWEKIVESEGQAATEGIPRSHPDLDAFLQRQKAEWAPSVASRPPPKDLEALAPTVANEGCGQMFVGRSDGKPAPALRAGHAQSTEHLQSKRQRVDDLCPRHQAKGGGFALADAGLQVKEEEEEHAVHEWHRVLRGGSKSKRKDTVLADISEPVSAGKARHHVEPLKSMDASNAAHVPRTPAHGKGEQDQEKHRGAERDNLDGRERRKRTQTARFRLSSGRSHAVKLEAEHERRSPGAAPSDSANRAPSVEPGTETPVTHLAKRPKRESRTAVGNADDSQAHETRATPAGQRGNDHAAGVAREASPSSHSLCPSRSLPARASRADAAARPWPMPLEPGDLVLVSGNKQASTAFIGPFEVRQAVVGGQAYRLKIPQGCADRSAMGLVSDKFEAATLTLYQKRREALAEQKRHELSRRKGADAKAFAVDFVLARRQVKKGADEALVAWRGGSVVSNIFSLLLCSRQVVMLLALALVQPASTRLASLPFMTSTHPHTPHTTTGFPVETECTWEPIGLGPGQIREDWCVHLTTGERAG